MHVLLWVSGLSLLFSAGAVGVIAWRMARGERVRESARVELLKTLAFPDASTASASGLSTSNWTPRFMSEQKTAPAEDSSEPFEPARPIFGERRNLLTTVPRWWISLFAVGAAIALGVTLYARLLGGPGAAPSATAPADHATAAPAAPAVPDRPIELIDLQYRLGKAAALDVSGLVRNPADGRELPQLMAVVDLLGADGRILESQTMPLERPGLEAGQTSAFSLVFPRVTGGVASYKIQFRLPNGGMIRLIDRRTPGPAAKTRSF